MLLQELEIRVRRLLAQGRGIEATDITDLDAGLCSTYALHELARNVASDDALRGRLQKNYVVNFSGGEVDLSGATYDDLLTDFLECGYLADPDGNRMHWLPYYTDLIRPQQPDFSYWTYHNGKIYTRRLADGSLTEITGSGTLRASFVPIITASASTLPSIFDDDIVTLTARVYLTRGQTDLLPKQKTD